MIDRTFQNLPKEAREEADQLSFLGRLGSSGGLNWNELLRSKRVLIVSEAGAGKTFECRAQQERLWALGEPAFFLELATLANADLHSMLDDQEGARLDAWLTSQSDVATFFLDSIDELKLTLGSFEQALKRLRKGIAGQLGRARIVITTRPIPFDEQLVRRVLPVPEVSDIESDENSFARIAMGEGGIKRDSRNQDTVEDWRTVALMPLSDEQILTFASAHGVSDPQALLADLHRRNAEEFAKRPQDLLELCADWRDFKRIRTHREQVATNVRIKLKPREDRQEPAQLSVERAIGGASRLALAMMLTRRLTIRHSVENDTSEGEAALDPAIVLSDWTIDERKALLERPLFGFASYGRVRFHHRSVAEYLAAQRLAVLRAQGMSARALKRILFARTRQTIIARPSKRPAAGWLALSDQMVFETLRDHEPAVLLTEGDPESLTLSQRREILRAYVERFGKGGWRGLQVPHVQIHRFASPDLGPEINQLWADGIENSEVREILLHVVETGRIAECADLAYATALNPEISYVERVGALDALIAINDGRLEGIAASVADDAVLWPDALARGALLRLFPEHLSVTRLCKILARVREEEDTLLSALTWQFPRLITNAELDESSLESLRDGLASLVSTGLRWQSDWPHVVSDYSHLENALAATCVRGLKAEKPAWLRASVLAIRLHDRHKGGDDDAVAQLKKLLAALPAKDNEQLFWADDEFMQAVRPKDDPWKRYARLAYEGAAQIERDRDLSWIMRSLGNPYTPFPERAMLLEAAMRLAPWGGAWREEIIALKPVVADNPELLAKIEDSLKPLQAEKEHKRWEIEEARRREQRERKDAKNRASWVIFWREVADHPDTAFAADRQGNTAWNLWRAMAQAGEEGRSSGWNRRFIEAHFGKEVADRLRLTLMEQWRNDRPTLASERPESEKNTYLVRWQLGLAAIYAEAEDPQWATKLSPSEAELACRYAPIELNGLPLWMESLASAHPGAVDVTLGNELTLQLSGKAGAGWHSMLLQNIGQAPDSVAALFVPRLRNWLDSPSTKFSGDNEDGAPARLERVLSSLLKHGDDELREHIGRLAQSSLDEKPSLPIARVWLSALMRLKPQAGVEALEGRIASIEPSQRSEAVTWFAALFGDRHDAINLTKPAFTPNLLLQLLRLSYRHVRPADDVKHVGAYTPDERDNATWARNQLVNALLDANGEEGWAAKLEMAADPLFAHFKYRIRAVAEERWAEEIDAVALTEEQAVELDRTCEAPPATNEAMFGVLLDRLDELDELLLRDVSPRAAWAGIKDEKIMRRVIARELSLAANGIYKVDQEAVTGDEKETDIRLRSTSSPYEAVIELKLADGRTARDLCDTLEKQLVTKYMASEFSRSGALLLTLAADRKWQHPETGLPIGFADLVALLREEAERVSQSLGGTLQLHVHTLDLRPRLAAERTKVRTES